MRTCCLAAFLVGAFVVGAVGATFATNADQRLVTVRKGFVVAADELTADRPVAICFAERLSRMTAIESVKRKEEADVVFRIATHVYNANVPPFAPSTAGIVAELPDGTALWSDKHEHGIEPDGIECLLADDLLRMLRDAITKARDAKR